MAVPALTFSEAFREGGKMKGTVLAGEWKIPEGLVAIFCSKNGNVGESGGAEIAGYSDAAELRASVKKWHGCKDTDTVAFVEWE